ncbi:hypothetical protein FRB90_001407 [Tulasnella sp. 427]|nr:hypothetical protein FRB90_001407 [Tulasnella sp. 427]
MVCTTVYMPQQNSVAEWLNRTLNDGIAWWCYDRIEKKEYSSRDATFLKETPYYSTPQNVTIKRPNLANNDSSDSNNDKGTTYWLPIPTSSVRTPAPSPPTSSVPSTAQPSIPPGNSPAPAQPPTQPTGPATPPPPQNN